MQYDSEQIIREKIAAMVGYKTSQTALAKKFGVSQSYLNQFLCGNKKANAALLKALGYSPERHYQKRGKQ